MNIKNENNTSEIVLKFLILWYQEKIGFKKMEQVFLYCYIELLLLDHIYSTLYYSIKFLSIDISQFILKLTF